MNLPVQFPYDPTSKVIALPLFAGIVWVCLQILWGSRTVHSFGFWFGTATLAMGLLLAARRFFLKRFLVLDNQALNLPTGVGRLRSVQIPYNTILQIRHARLLWMRVLRVATKDGTYEILSGLLPDAASYIKVSQFLTAVAADNKDSFQPERPRESQSD
jgi:hypothetical protein